MTKKVQIDQLVRSLLQKDSLEQCSLQELEQFAGRHPYFGAAQLLLAKKMQVEQADGYHDQLQKTYLFFNNPLWVQQLLGETGNASVHPAPETVPPPEVIVERPAEVAAPPEAEIKETTNPPVEVATPVANTPTTTQGAADLTFEPYHTVDYFASQGIKWKPEDKPQDKFGQQLKSFTDWLKTMKRLPATELATKSEPEIEKKVEQLAAHSLDEKEVLTEAMAEVWTRQGNTEKAREIYRKLSLLDPSKSAYFAAKIEDLQK